MRHDSLVGNNNPTPNRFFKNFAQDYLNYLGDSQPTEKQMMVIQALEAHSRIKQSTCVDVRLTAGEKEYLYLAARGKKHQDIAASLKVSLRQISQCRKSVCQKLGCKNVTSAIILGLRFGEIPVPDID